MIRTKVPDQKLNQHSRSTMLPRRSLTTLITIFGLAAPPAAGHGMLMHPPNWFMSDGLPRVCPMTEGADWSIGAMWYTNYTHVPEGTPIMP